jgi:hypothetical protein
MTWSFSSTYPKHNWPKDKQSPNPRISEEQSGTTCHLHHVDCSCSVMMATPREGQPGSNYLINVCCRSLELNTGLEIVVCICNGTVRYLHTSSTRETKEDLSDWRFSRRWLWRMVSSGMLHRVALVRTEVSEEFSASFIRVTRIDELGTTLALTSNRHFFAACVGCYLQPVLFLVHRFLSPWWRRR